MTHQKDSLSREEIRKEFQLERMIVFSDAVFAIVITLMAIEIRLPDDIHEVNGSVIGPLLRHLAPSIIAYVASFCFIGAIWYEHLKIFSLLKDYDKGLVVRNLIMLFFIGLFPFCASIVGRVNHSFIPFVIYMGVILVCMTAQYVLHRYILHHETLTIRHELVEEHKIRLWKSKISLMIMAPTMILIFATYELIPRTEMKSFAMLWMMIFPILFRIITKKPKKIAESRAGE